jgi:hypothetical protein
MNRSTVERLLRQIENLPLETLQHHPELERLVPTLYELLQIDDECDHQFVDGICICGSKINTSIGENNVNTTIQYSS